MQRGTSSSSPASCLWHGQNSGACGSSRLCFRCHAPTRFWQTNVRAASFRARDQQAGADHCAKERAVNRLSQLLQLTEA